MNIKPQQEILIAGSGGQGVLSAGKILAQAAVEQGKFVTYYPSYGAEIRGGTANCTIIISDKEIASPVCANPQTMLVFNAPSYRKFAGRIANTGLLLINSSLCAEPVPPANSGIKLVNVPASELAQELGDVRSTNIIMLGVYAQLTGLVTRDSLTSAIRLFFGNKKDIVELNLKALEKGFGLKI
jgi:2-oxoglutarate ferredoxin oxidoreductase subunit gamma